MRNDQGYYNDITAKVVPHPKKTLEAPTLSLKGFGQHRITTLEFFALRI